MGSAPRWLDLYQGTSLFPGPLQSLLSPQPYCHRFDGKSNPPPQSVPRMSSHSFGGVGRATSGSGSSSGSGGGAGGLNRAFVRARVAVEAFAAVFAASKPPPGRALAGEEPVVKLGSRTMLDSVRAGRTWDARSNRSVVGGGSTGTAIPSSPSSQTSAWLVLGPVGNEMEGAAAASSRILFFSFFCFFLKPSASSPGLGIALPNSLPVPSLQ